MHSPANATNARPVITLIPALLFVLRTRRSEVRILSSAPILSLVFNGFPYLLSMINLTNQGQCRRFGGRHGNPLNRTNQLQKFRG